ncbi:MAG: ribose-phosphate pyrophosphokinase [Bdellovibrionaceae bacterium]|nr:ribose-phosphate pyrophosphokinase [Pseudobdellovibrionaceae bacterium]
MPQYLPEIKLFTGNANPEFAKKVANHLKKPLVDCSISRFADGEIQIEINESVRGCRCFVIQSTCPPANEHYMELFLMLDSLRRASATEITVVMPYYGYSRQDRKVSPRAPISAKAVAQLCESSGANRILAVDLHSTQIQGFFNIPVDNLFTVNVLAEKWLELEGLSGEDCVVISPDAGGVSRARAFASKLKCNLGIIDKQRINPNKAKALRVIGNVEGKTAIIIDDMIDTAGTLTQATEVLLKSNAKAVYAMGTHPVLSDPAIERIENSGLTKVFVTDTIPLKRASKKIHVLSVSELVANSIYNIQNNQSISSLF